MKQLAFVIIFALLVCGCTKKDKFYVSDVREDPYLYYDSISEGYVTFEKYMWTCGFPDTIIVDFKWAGRDLGYTEAVRWGDLEDSLGNCYSPEYVIIDQVGNSWVYDFKGQFVQFYESDFESIGHGQETDSCSQANE